MCENQQNFCDANEPEKKTLKTKKFCGQRFLIFYRHFYFDEKKYIFLFVTLRADLVLWICRKKHIDCKAHEIIF